MSRIIFTLLLLSPLFFSCKHEACAKPDAINYDKGAEKDDGSCMFQSEVLFWFNQSISDSLIASGTNQLSFYVNEVSLGTVSTSQFSNEEPDCDIVSTGKFDIEMGNHEKSLYIYKVYNESNNVAWTGTINFYANTCHPVALYN